MAKYDGINFKAPDSVKAQYKMGLDNLDKAGDGIESSTIRQARNIVAGNAISPEWARKGNRFWGRNERFLDEEQGSPAWVSAKLWGGKPGMAWFGKLFRQMESADKRASNNAAGNHMPQVRVNVRARVNNADIRWEKRNGRDYIVVPSATLPDNVVMNGGLYPAEEIEKSYQTLDGTLAPFGHPQIDNVYISAFHPMAINEFHVGAYNENARRDGGRVFVDKAIDVEVAKQTENGRRMLDAINKGDPIHTSTGIMLEQEMVDNADDDLGYSWIARNMLFDHDAILLDEVGAATPSQGVGMMVNSQNEKQEIQVLNFSLEECAQEDMEFAAMRMAEAIVRMDTAKAMDGIKDRILGAVRGLFGSGGGSAEPDSNGADGLSVNNEEGDTMPITEEQFKALEDKVEKALSTNSAEELKQTVSEAVGEAVKPLNDKIEALETNAKQAEEDKRVELVQTVVNAGLLDEDEAKELPLSALNKLAAKSKPGMAHNMASGLFGNANQDDWSDELPGGEA